MICDNKGYRAIVLGGGAALIVGSLLILWGTLWIASKFAMIDAALHTP